MIIIDDPLQIIDETALTTINIDVDDSEFDGT